jgi:flagellar hook assembly protein FlgD
MSGAFLLLIMAWGLSGPKANELDPNYPDPFCPHTEDTSIPFTIMGTTYLVLSVEDFYGNHVRSLASGEWPPGFHISTWDGLSDEEAYVGTGVFWIVLELESGPEPRHQEDPCTTFCDTGLEGPYRRQIGLSDAALAFAVGLDSAETGSLLILESDSTTLVRNLATGIFPPGVSMHEWNLRDEMGSRVGAGLYVCRLETPSYTELIAFSANPIEMASFTISLKDVHDTWQAGSSDSASPTVVESPVSELLCEFGRPLSTEEWDDFWQSIDGIGVFNYFPDHDWDTDSMYVAPDTSWFHLPECRSTRPWEDVLGTGAMLADSLWMDPYASHFRLKHTFSGITWMSTACDSCGTVDTTDWNCRTGPDMLMLAADTPVQRAIAGIDSVVPTYAYLGPACPNPVLPETFTRVYFGLPEGSHVRIQIFDTNGHVVKTLTDQYAAAGHHSIAWDLRDSLGSLVSEGTYHVMWDEGRWGFLCSGDIWITGEGASVDPRISATRSLPIGLRVYPSPCQLSLGARIDLMLGGDSPVTVTVHDVVGRRVSLLLRNRMMEKGPHSITWDCRDRNGTQVPPGVYFVQLQANDQVATRKVVLVR